MLLGVAPFGVIYGVVALQSGIPAPAAMAMSSIVFAGSAQFLLAQLVGCRRAVPAAAGAVGLVNLRHALYSASVAPLLAHLPRRWKVLLAYLLTDEAYAAAIPHLLAARPGSPQASARTGSCSAPVSACGPAGSWPPWRGADRCATAGRIWGWISPAADLHRHRGADDLHPSPCGRRACGRCAAVLLAALPYKLGLFLAALVGLAVGAALGERHDALGPDAGLRRDYLRHPLFLHRRRRSFPAATMVSTACCPSCRLRR
jgi:hypothetical protein